MSGLVGGESTTEADAVGGTTVPSERLASVDSLVGIVAGSASSSPPTGDVQVAAGPALLGTAGDFSILGSSTITNTGLTTIVGDVGLSPGSAVTGFAPCTPPAPANCVALTGALHVADGVALQAQIDQLTAYNSLVGLGSSCTPVGVELAGHSFLPGTYCSPGTFNLSAGGIVFLDAQGNPDAQFVFLTGAGGSTLITGAASQVLVTGGAQACNVYWQVASSATIGANTAFVGHILASQSVQLQTGATLQGSAFAHNGAVTLDTNTITRADCRAGPVPTPPGGGTPGGGTPGGGPTGGGTPGGGTPIGGTTRGGSSGSGTIGGTTGAVTVGLATTGLTGAGTPGAMTTGQVTVGGGTLGGRPGGPNLALTGASVEWELLLAGVAIGLGGLMRRASRPGCRARR